MHCFLADDRSDKGAAQPLETNQQAKRYDLVIVYLKHTDLSPQCTDCCNKAEASFQQDLPTTSHAPHSEQQQHRQNSLYSWLDDLVGCLSADPAAKTYLVLVLMLSNLPGSSTAVPQVRPPRHLCYHISVHTSAAV